MGNFEKLVVLTVLFLSAIVLAVSLNRKSEAREKNPMEAAAKELGADPDESEHRILDRDREAGGEPGATELLLNSEVKPSSKGSGTKASAEPEELAGNGRAVGFVTAGESPGEDGRIRILQTTEGLEPATIGDDFMVYTPRSDETWSALAQRFYGAARMRDHLERYNEGLPRPLKNTVILVPIYDFTRDAGNRTPFRPLERVGERSRGNSGATTAAPSFYEVRSGDNLSTISEAVYGTAVRWEEIYEANRDILDDPNWLQVGMKLKIPR